MLTQWSLHCRNSDQKDLRKKIIVYVHRTKHSWVQEKMLVNIIYAGQTMYMLYYVLLLEVKWLLAGHLFPVQLPRFTSFHAQGVSLFCVQTFPSPSF